jgi:hypothetical protein
MVDGKQRNDDKDAFEVQQFSSVWLGTVEDGTAVVRELMKSKRVRTRVEQATMNHRDVLVIRRKRRRQREWSRWQKSGRVLHVVKDGLRSMVDLRCPNNQVGEASKTMRMGKEGERERVREREGAKESGRESEQTKRGMRGRPNKKRWIDQSLTLSNE